MNRNYPRRPVRMTVTGFALSLASLCASGDATSAPIPYYDPVSFNNALASTTVLEDYESYTGAVVDDPFTPTPPPLVFGQTVPNPGTLGVLTYSFTGGATGLIDGSRFATSSGGNALANSDANGIPTGFAPGTEITVTFPNPVTAVAVYFNGEVSSSAGDFFIRTANGETVSNIYNPVTGPVTVGGDPTLFFVGLTSSTPFTSATFGATATSPFTFTLDDVLAGTAQVGGTPVPGPAAAVVFAGLMVVGFGIRRKG